MRKNFYLTLIAIVCVVNVCRAQIRHTITATIIDSTSREPIELATIVILKVSDSSLVSYTLTDKKGQFTFHNIKDSDPIRLLISHVAYQSLHVKLKFTGAELLSLGTLTLSTKNLTEIIVKGEMAPVVIRKDTIDFNAEAFKVRPNALVQDLLKKLPGMQVDRDGTITFNGKAISKIKVDGRDFFANDPKIATRNLDADMIARVQVYDDRENDPAHLQPDWAVKKIINLKFKKKFSKATFGHVTAGGGTQGKYNLDGLYNKSIDNLQVTAIGNSKNLGSTEFIGTSLTGFGPGEGTRQVTNTGVNINDNFGKKVKLNLVYNYSNNIFNNQQQVNVAQFLGDTVLTNNSSNKIHNVTNQNTVNGTIDWTPDSATDIKYVPQLGFNTNKSNGLSQVTSFNNFTPLLSKSVNNNNDNGSGTQYQHTLTYYHSFKKKGESLTITSDVQVNPLRDIAISADNLMSFTAGLTSDTLDRLANNTTRNTTAGLSVGYNYPLSKTITAGFNANGNYLNNGADLITYDLDPKTGLYNLFLPDQSSNLVRDQWQQSAHPQLVYIKKNININIGVIAQTNQIDNQFHNSVPNLNQHFTYLFPSVSVSVNKISFNYGEDVQQPTVSQLQPITVVYNQLNSFTGNPDLKPMRLRNFAIRYNDYNMQSNIFIFLSAQVKLEDNSIIQESFVNAQGAQLTTPINKNGRFTTYVSASISKPIKNTGDWRVSENININGSAGHNFFEVNDKDGYQDTYALPLSEITRISWKDVIEFEPSYYINPAITRYELVNYPNQSYVQQTISLPLDVQWPKRLSWNINYTHIYNPLVAQGFQRQSNLLSFSVAQAFQQKDKGEIRLTCYDILNQGISAMHYASNNTINDIQNEAIRRYFLLSYTYRFAKTK